MVGFVLNWSFVILSFFLCLKMWVTVYNNVLRFVCLERMSWPFVWLLSPAIVNFLAPVLTNWTEHVRRLPLYLLFPHYHFRIYCPNYLVVCYCRSIALLRPTDPMPAPSPRPELWSMHSTPNKRPRIHLRFVFFPFCMVLLMKRYSNNGPQSYNTCNAGSTCLCRLLSSLITCIHTNTVTRPHPP